MHPPFFYLGHSLYMLPDDIACMYVAFACAYMQAKPQRGNLAVRLPRSAAVQPAELTSACLLGPYPNQARRGGGAHACTRSVPSTQHLACQHLAV